MAANVEFVGFHSRATGRSIVLSGHGQVVASRRHFARGIAIGRTPCPQHGGGKRGFRLLVQKTDALEYASGLWIGFTAMRPGDVAQRHATGECLDFAADVPDSCAAGGEGYMWDGCEFSETSWNTGNLRKGDEVSAMLLASGEFIVEVNNEPVLWEYHARIPLRKAVFPLVELHGRARSVELLGDISPFSGPAVQEPELVQHGHDVCELESTAYPCISVPRPLDFIASPREMPRIPPRAHAPPVKPSCLLSTCQPRQVHGLVLQCSSDDGAVCRSFGSGTTATTSESLVSSMPSTPRSADTAVVDLSRYLPSEATTKDELPTPTVFEASSERKSTVVESAVSVPGLREMSIQEASSETKPTVVEFAASVPGLRETTMQEASSVGKSVSAPGNHEVTLQEAWAGRFRSSAQRSLKAASLDKPHARSDSAIVKRNFGRFGGWQAAVAKTSSRKQEQKACIEAARVSGNHWAWPVDGIFDSDHDIIADA